MRRRSALNDYILYTDDPCRNNRRCGAAALFDLAAVMSSESTHADRVLRTTDFLPIGDYLRRASVIRGLELSDADIDDPQLRYLRGARLRFPSIIMRRFLL